VFDTDAELQQRLPFGEDGFLEFKEVRYQGTRLTLDLTELAEAACGFANREGGSILLGVAKTGEVLGVERGWLDDLQQRVVGALRDLVRPAPLFTLRIRLLENQAGQKLPVVEITVSKSLSAHEVKGRLFDRQGSVTRAMSLDEIARKLQERGRKVVMEERPVDRASLKDLDHGKLVLYLTRHTRLPDSDMPRDVAAMTEEERVRFLDLLRSRGVFHEDQPTVLGIMCFGHDPQAFLPNFTVDCLHYEGVSLADNFLDRKNCTGTLDRLIDGASVFLRNRIAAQGLRDGAGRRDEPDYDSLAVREAVTNAVAHRDYGIEGSPIVIRLFADRLEVSSPGAPPNSLRIEEFGFGARPVRRNQLMVDYLRHADFAEPGQTPHAYMEAEGGGLGTIRTRCLALSGREPKFEMIGLELRVTLFPRTPNKH
jgi:predicted HTH transcriptional regulator